MLKCGKNHMKLNISNIQLYQTVSELYTNNDAKHKLLDKVLQFTRDTIKAQKLHKYNKSARLEKPQKHPKLVVL